MADMPLDFFGGAGVMSNQRVRTISMNYSVMRGGFPGKDHVYLVDCGFKAPVWFERYPFYDWEAPSSVLARIGLTPEDVEAILVTHVHFGHIDQVEDFPRAQINIQTL